LVISIDQFFEITKKISSNKIEIQMDIVEDYYNEFGYVVNNFLEDIICYAETGLITISIKDILIDFVGDILFLESEEDIQGLFVAFQMLIADDKKIDVNYENLTKITTDIFVRIIETLIN
jgi:hypothetical protein